MGIVLDCVLVAIFVVCVLIAAKKGFVRSLLEVVGYVLAILLAFNLSPLIADSVYNSAVEPVVIEAIGTAVENGGAQALENTPDFVASILNTAGVDLENLAETVEGGAQQTAQNITDSVVQPIAMSVLKTVFAVLIFVLLMIAVNILAKFLNSLFKGAILGTANKTLGAALGGVKGLIFASAFAMLVYFISAVTTDGILFFNNAAIENSAICRYIVDFITSRI